MSGLTKKQIYADQYLSTILGVSEGTLVSYADIQKGLHGYIKKNNLRMESGAAPPSVQPKPSPTPSAPQPQPAPRIETGAQAQAPPASTEPKVCPSCGEQVPRESAFCDLCGARQ